MQNWVYKLLTTLVRWSADDVSMVAASGELVEAEVATTDHHETAAGPCATGGKDLH